MGVWTIGKSVTDVATDWKGGGGDLHCVCGLDSGVCCLEGGDAGGDVAFDGVEEDGVRRGGFEGEEGAVEFGLGRGEGEDCER